MPSTPHTQRDVARRAWLGRVAALVFASAGVGVAAVGLPGAELGPLATNPRPLPPPPETSEPENASLPIDYDWLSERFDALATVTPPAAPEPTPDEPVQPDEPKQTPTRTTGPPIAFLGSIIEPGRRVALLRIDGAQRFIREGETLNDVELLEVTPDSVRVRLASGERTVAKATRKGVGITEITGDAGRNRTGRDPAAEARERMNPRNRPTRRPERSGNQ
ncbi:MAG: hypothetical protein AAGK04_03480 [Planctomycetota bacterium]